MIVSEEPAPAVDDPAVRAAPDNDLGPTRGWLAWADRIVLGLVIVAGLVVRFIARTPLWLDEALTVNIAAKPIGQIPEALRHDGHPPLFYVLLHGWMKVFGTSDTAVRALAGLFGVALILLIWVATKRVADRRVAWLAVLVVSVCPYAIRYSTETRMYSLVMVLSLGAWLVADDALEKPTWPRFAGLALLTAALLYSHYWAMWLVGAAALGLLGLAWRMGATGRSTDRRAALGVFGALVAGGVLFLPWVPVLLYQGAHTGTPWGSRVLPSGIISNTLADVGGGPTAEAVLFGGACAILILMALFVRPLSARYLEVDLHTQPDARPMAVLYGGTMAIAALAAYATQSTFVTRYTAVVFPFFVVLVAIGLGRLRSRVALRLALCALIVLGGVGAVRNSKDQRSSARVTAVAILAHAQAGDVVLSCPDQLGVSTARELDKHSSVPLQQMTFPRFARPEFVDWVDYTKVIKGTSTTAFARQLRRRIGDHNLFVIWDPDYVTHKDVCESMLAKIGQDRPLHFQLLADRGDKYYEHGALWYFPGPAIAAQIQQGKIPAPTERH